MICVYRGTGPTDAYLARDWLERNGIAARLQGEVSNGLLGHLPLLETWPSVWVNPAEAQRSRQALDQLFGPQLVHPEWACPSCGEPNGPAFAACWQCGHDRPQGG